MDLATTVRPPAWLKLDENSLNCAGERVCGYAGGKGKKCRERRSESETSRMDDDV